MQLKKKKADIKNVKRNQRQKNREGAKPQRAPCRGHGRMSRGGVKRAARAVLQIEEGKILELAEA